jgi:hypothetical protein
MSISKQSKGFVVFTFLNLTNLRGYFGSFCASDFGVIVPVISVQTVPILSVRFVPP